MIIADDHGQTGYGSDPAEVILEIAAEVPAERREVIKASVAALARRSAEASRRALERSRAQHELLTAAARPLSRLSGPPRMGGSASR
jgi:hypothetical protein